MLRPLRFAWPFFFSYSVNITRAYIPSVVCVRLIFACRGLVGSSLFRSCNNPKADGVNFILLFQKNLRLFLNAQLRMKKHRISKAAIVADLRRVARLLNHSPSTVEYDKIRSLSCPNSPAKICCFLDCNHKFSWTLLYALYVTKDSNHPGTSIWCLTCRAKNLDTLRRVPITRGTENMDLKR